jgi:nucleoside-diphosphate-sugar epimerase
LVNHIGTEILAKAAKEAGIKRFIFASSCSIYSAFRHTPGQTVPTFDEDSEVQIQGPYALSRRAAEECLLELADGSFHPVIFRKGTLYGFSPKMRYDLVLNAFTKDAFRQGKITVNAAGDIDRPILDVQDAVEAYIAALELPISAVSGKIFNLMSSNIQLIDLANMFKKILKETKNKVVEIDLKPFDVTVSYRANGTRFQKTFNFKPKRTLEAAILEIWDQLEDGHDYENLKYYNDPWHFEALKQGLL